jgi:hypothetical protein
MFWHASREGKHGIRAWWHFGDRSVFHTEVNWWTHFCHASISNDEEGWTLSLALPPLAIWLIFDARWLPLPQRLVHFTWETPPRSVWLPEGRECKISIHDWTIHVNPWSRTMEWAARDPWWVRGVSLDLKRLVLGRQRCDVEVLKSGIPVVVPMPEGVYHGTAKIERRTWKRPRWFAFSRVSTTIDCPKGIPHAGKGENSWDCGDDGLFGWGAEGESLEKAIAHGVEIVLTARRRYGHASDAAVAEALR